MKKNIKTTIILLSVFMYFETNSKYNCVKQKNKNNAELIDAIASGSKLTKVDAG